MSTPYSIRAELAAAFRQVGAIYNGLPSDRRPVVRWSATDDLLEEALRTDDRTKALAAIDEWKTHWLQLFGEMMR